MLAIVCGSGQPETTDRNVVKRVIWFLSLLMTAVAAIKANFLPRKIKTMVLRYTYLKAGRQLLGGELGAFYVVPFPCKSFGPDRLWTPSVVNIIIH